MSHFAKIETGIVTEVIVAEQDFINTLSGTWIETSYTGSIRKNYAGIGDTYDSTRDAFISPKPFSSWTLDKFGVGVKSRSEVKALSSSFCFKFKYRQIRSHPFKPEKLVSSLSRALCFSISFIYFVSSFIVLWQSDKDVPPQN